MKANNMINSKNITLLTPIDDINHFLNSKNEQCVFPELVLKFINTFSDSILKLPNVKQSPDLVALAFWMRKSNIKRLQQSFYENCNGKLKAPVGTVIHFSPSNVDTIFIYSLFISLMVGNSNIVRVSSKESYQKDVLIGLLKDTLIKTEFKSLQKSLSIVTYPHSDEITAFLCSKVDMRVIWGGDETVNTVSAFPLAPTATEIKFANKYSLSVVDAKEISTLNYSEFNKLISNFVNDSYWFAQQGCSSPRTVMWLNQEKYNEGVERFWGAVAAKAETLFSDDIVIADVMNKIVASSLCATKLEKCRVISSGKMLTRIILKDILTHNELRSLHCGSGLFLESSIESLAELKNIVDRKTQTVSYFGFDLDYLKKEFMGNSIYPDRIVPIGKALNFSITWDGYDLFQSMTRTIDFV